MSKVTSYDIKRALKEVHDKRPTYFITECKTCSTYFPDQQGLLIFDGLAITKSYTKPCITGYEIMIVTNDRYELPAAIDIMGAEAAAGFMGITLNAFRCCMSRWSWGKKKYKAIVDNSGKRRNKGHGNDKRGNYE